MHVIVARKALRLEARRGPGRRADPWRSLSRLPPRSRNIDIFASDKSRMTRDPKARLSSSQGQSNGRRAVGGLLVLVAVDALRLCFFLCQRDMFRQKFEGGETAVKLLGRLILIHLHAKDERYNFAAVRRNSETMVVAGDRRHEAPVAIVASIDAVSACLTAFSPPPCNEAHCSRFSPTIHVSLCTH